MTVSWKAVAPIAIAVLIALVPAPAGLPQHAWYFFAIFVGVIVGLMFESLPEDVFGAINVAPVTGLSKHVQSAHAA